MTHLLQIAVKKKGRDEGREGGKKEKKKVFIVQSLPCTLRGPGNITRSVFSLTSREII